MAWIVQGMSALTVVDRVTRWERGGRGPGDPFPTDRDEAARQFEWERLLRHPKPRRSWSEDPAHPAPTVSPGRLTDIVRVHKAG